MSELGAPNELFSAVSFVAFVFCFIPLYWHLEGTFLSLLTCTQIWLTGSTRSLECRNVHGHFLDWIGLPELLYQLNHLESQRYRLGSHLVRHQYVLRFLFWLKLSRLTGDQVLALWSQCPLASHVRLSLSTAVFTRYRPCARS
jgi:hypothetical protein